MNEENKTPFKVLTGLEYPRGTVRKEGSYIALTKEEAGKFADGFIEEVKPVINYHTITQEDIDSNNEFGDDMKVGEVVELSIYPKEVLEECGLIEKEEEA